MNNFAKSRRRRRFENEMFGAAVRLSPQARKVFNHLVDVGSITALEASGLYRARSLSRRICDIKEAFPSISIWKQHKKDHTGQRYVRYVLI